jgi:hypothetical protein
MAAAIKLRIQICIQRGTLRAENQGLAKMAIIVDIIKDKYPRAMLFNAEPAIHQSKDVDTGALTPWYLDAVGKHLKSLFDPCCITSMDPEHPCLGRGISYSIRIFNR